MFMKSRANLKLLALGALHVRNCPFMLRCAVRNMVHHMEIGPGELLEMLGRILDGGGRGDKLKRRCAAVISK